MQLALEPEFWRGDGRLSDALAAWPVDYERLFSLLTEVLTPLVDGPEARGRPSGVKAAAHHATATDGDGP